MVTPRKKTVLLVDDDDDVRAFLAAVLEAGGFDVLPAEDGETALRLAEEAPIDLLLTDIRMPKLDGRELARRLAAGHPKLRILFVSGYPGPDADGLDTSRLIQKPVKAADLIRQVRRALRRRPASAQS